MDFQSPNSLAAIFGALLVITVFGTLLVAIATTARAHVAKSRATKLVMRARNLLTLGVYGRDKQDNPGPAELLGEAYRLQRQFHLKAGMIGLRDDKELDELIKRAIRGNAPPAITPASEVDTLPEIKVQAPDFGTAMEEDEHTQPDIHLADRIAAAHADSVHEEDVTEEYLKSCADMAAGLDHRINREDIN